MFQYLFPIFCFGVVVAGIVLKGMLLAAEMNRSQLSPETEGGGANPQLARRRFVTKRESPTPVGLNGSRRTASFSRVIKDRFID